MAETQTYRVETIYDLTDRTSSKLGEIEKSARAAAASTSSLKQMVMGLGAVHLGSMAIGKAKTLLIDYNSSLEQSKTVIAGMLSLYTGASIDRTWDRASVSVERFQEMAKKSSLTTKELVETAQGLTRPLIQVGVKMADIEKITFGVANAAKAFGMNGAVVSMDVEQALRGGVTERDRFIKSMLAQKGVELSADQFNKKGQQERIAILKKALTSPAISAMADKQSQTMSGVLSTLEDNIQIALGKVGLPLFKAITEEVKGWNAWIDKNAGRLEEIGKSVGNGVMVAFRTIKEIGSAVFPILKELMGVIVSAMRFAAEHKDTLVGLAKAMLVFKIGQTVGRMGMGAINDVRGFGGGMMGSIGAIKDALGGFKTGASTIGSMFGTLATNLPGVIGGLAKLSIAAYALGGFLFGKTETQKKQEAAAAARTLSADAYKNTRKEVMEMERELRSFSGGADPLDAKFASPALKAQQEALRQKKADLDKTQADVLEQGKKAGFVDVAADGDQRVVKLRAASGSTVEYGGHNDLFKANTKLLGQLGDIFSDKGTFSKSTMTGMFKEAILEADKKETAEEFDANVQANAPKQTINVTIQQMTAKDPNRWLAEIDDIANRRNRAPTRPKRGWKGTPK